MEVSLVLRPSAGLRKTLDRAEVIEKMEDASLATEESCIPEDTRRLARRKMVDTVDAIDVLVWRDGVRDGFTWNWEGGRPCDVDADGKDGSGSAAGDKLWILKLTAAIHAIAVWPG